MGGEEDTDIFWNHIVNEDFMDFNFFFNIEFLKMSIFFLHYKENIEGVRHFN